MKVPLSVACWDYDRARALIEGYAGVDGIYDFERVPQRGLDVNDAVVTLWDPAKKNWQVVSEPAGAPLGQ
jgi:branched-chain amino acid transport system substrate-binding protein